MHKEQTQTGPATQEEAVVSATAPQNPGVGTTEKSRRSAAKPKAKGQAGSAKSRAKGRAPGMTETRTATPRSDSKGGKILKMIRRPKGATLAEIMKSTSWQAHSVRGFMSTAGRRYGVRIESTRNEAGERVYRATE